MTKNRSVSEIVRVEAKGINTFIYFEDEHFERLSSSIDALEERFLEWDFIRIHPNHLINPNYYYGICYQQTPCVEMSDGTKLPTDNRLVDVESLLPERKLSVWKKISTMFSKNR